MKNPILTAELNHQWYVMEKSRSGGLWIGIAVIMLVPAALTSLIMFFGVLFFDIPISKMPFVVGEPIDLLRIGQVMLLIMNIAMTLVVMLVSFGLATNSITREKNGKTWDSLILTNVSARKLVWGKWLASLKALDGDHIMVTALRLGLMAWIVAGFRERLPIEGFSVQVHMLLLTALMLIFSFIDAAFNTALGVCAMLAEIPGSVGSALFIGLRATSVAYSLWLFANIIIRMFAAPDAGYLVFGLVGLAVYALLVVLVLWAGERSAEKYSLLSPGYSMSNA